MLYYVYVLHARDPVANVAAEGPLLRKPNDD